MIFLEEALDKFEDLDPEVVFTVNSGRFLRPLEALVKKYGAGLNSAEIFCLVGELSVADIAGYLTREYEMSPDKAAAAVKELTDQVLEPLTRRLLLLNADPDKEGITAVQEKDALRQIFAENLLAELRENFLIKNAVNMRIFDLLEKDLNFKRELERVLYENNEPVTKNNIQVKKKSASPSIANWLKDFIDKNGTGDFNTVALSNYLTNSANTRNLSQQERTQLFSLFNLYRNLKFFPENIAGMPMEKWQIIPFDVSEVEAFKAARNKQSEEPETVEQAMTMEQKLSKYDWSKIVGIERRALLEQLGVSLKDFVKWSEEKK